MNDQADAEPGASVDWRDVLFGRNGALLSMFERLAEKRFPIHPTTQEEAVTFALERLSDDAFKLLRENFAGRSSPQTFAVRIFSNLLEDFSRRRFGRPRPPKALQRIGGVVIEIYRLLCLERHPVERVIDLLVRSAQATREDVRNMIGVVRRFVPDCGVRVIETSLTANRGDDSEDTSHQVDLPDPKDPLADRLEAEREDLLTLIGELIGPDEARSVGALARKLGETIGERDRAILRLHYGEALSVPEIAVVLASSDREVLDRLRNLGELMRDGAPQFVD